MRIKILLTIVLTSFFIISCTKQDEPLSEPLELEVLQAYSGVWDAEIEVCPNGPDSAAIKFTGVETIVPYGEYWIASDFDSYFMEDTIKVHSIVGYDLDRKKLVGMIIDHGPYPAYMTGEYDKAANTVHWVTEAKGMDGTPMTQQTAITQSDPDERILVLTVPGKAQNELKKFMEIRFIRQK